MFTRNSGNFLSIMEKYVRKNTDFRKQVNYLQTIILEEHETKNVLKDNVFPHYCCKKQQRKSKVKVFINRSGSTCGALDKSCGYLSYNRIHGVDLSRQYLTLGNLYPAFKYYFCS